jgi:NADPH:quinone reductase-like Zn-dependent oxidoreductase
MGVVEETGPGAHKFQRGQRVVAIKWPARSDPGLDTKKAAGTYQQYLAVHQDVLVTLLR